MDDFTDGGDCELTLVGLTNKRFRGAYWHINSFLSDAMKQVTRTKKQAPLVTVFARGLSVELQQLASHLENPIDCLKTSLKESALHVTGPYLKRL